MRTTRTLLALTIAAAVLPATAAQFDFYKLGNGNLADFLPSDGIACSGGDLCSSNIAETLGGDLTFSSGGIVAKATGTFNDGIAAVVQDHEPGWTGSKGAGLGVYHMTGDNSDDNITVGEMLTITFDQVIQLTRIALRAEGHNFTGWDTGATFLFNGEKMFLPNGIGYIDLDVTGSMFTFAFDSTSLAASTNGQLPTGDQFYLSAMTVQAVPEPSTYALVFGGLAAMGFIARRRKAA